MSAELQYPTNSDPKGLLSWARNLVSVLRRQNTTIATQVEATAQDDAATIEALKDYADEVQANITAADGYAQEVYDLYVAAAAARQAKLASHYLTEAQSRVEQFVRIEEDSVTAGRINTVAAYLAGSAATITDIETAVANGDTAIADRIATVETQAGGNTAAITTIQSSVNGISARWGVSIDLNGHVSGLVQLSGNASGSNFVVVANRFVVSMPSFGGTTITPFIVGSVNGISTVGINGNLVVDGSIVARHIAAGSIDATRINVGALSAITGNIGDITAGVLRSADNKFIIDLNNKTITITT